MKKWILLLFVVPATCVLKAQTGRDFDCGVKAGWSVTNISHSGLKDKMSGHLGAFAEWKINDYFGIQPELLYSRQGAREKYKDDDGKWKHKLQINYLNIPVLAKLYVLKRLSVDLGPQLGLALSVRNKIKGSSDDVTYIYKEKVKKFNTCDFSFALGASCSMGEFVLSARYNIGLTNVFNWMEQNNKNHVFQLSLGCCLNNLF